MPNPSVTFISTNGEADQPDIDFTDIIIAKIHARDILKTLKDLKLKAILILNVQGYTYYDISKEVRLHTRTIKRKIEDFEENFDSYVQN